jgi:PPK2 family polyphosphate:nucleotide phosphotransferase
MLLDPVPLGTRLKLSDKEATPSDRLPRGDEAHEALAALIPRLVERQAQLYAEGRRAVLVVLQARDAGGKDGTIGTVFGPLNSEGCTVTSFKRPSELELSHDFLWRVHQAVPPRGTIGVFNRSHYEDVLVVRVHELVRKSVWSKRYDQINAFEKMLTENGVTILKFFLHISRDEQRKRLLSRLRDPKKNWKFKPGDLDERKLWDDYTTAYRDMIERCSTAWAPWHVVPANRNSTRDLLVASTVLHALDCLDPSYPPADPAVIKAVGKFK